MLAMHRQEMRWRGEEQLQFRYASEAAQRFVRELVVNQERRTESRCVGERPQ